MCRIGTRFVQSAFRLLTGATLAVFCFITLSPVALAADRFWVGSGKASDRWESNANWAATAKGSAGANAPTASDTAIFNYSGGTVRIRSAVTVGGLIVNSVWTGSIVQGSGTIVVGSTGVRFGSGRFIGTDVRIANAGSWTQTGGIVTGIMNTFTLSGSLSVTKGSTSPYSTFTATGTVVFDGNADQNFTVGANVSKKFNNLTLENSGGGSSDDVIVDVNGGLFLSGALVITLGNLDLTTNSVALVVDGNVTLADAAQATMTTNSNMTLAGNVTVNNAATLTVSAGTTTLNGAADQTIDLDGQPLFALTINNSGGGSSDDIIIAANGQLLLSGALTITLGNLDLTTNTEPMVVDGGITLADAAQATMTTNSNVTASGTITVNDAATITVSAGTWTLNDDSDQTVDFDGQTLNALTINNTGGSTIDDVIVAADSGLNLAGALTITLGNLDLDTNIEALDVDGNVTLADAAQATLTGATMALAGDLTVGSNATFTQTTGTVTLDGTNQTLSGAITFNTLTKSVTSAATLTLAATNTITILKTLTLNGAASALLSLRSSQTGTQWKINPQSTRTVSFLDVKDSNNTNAVTVECLTSCTDSGNNTAWQFTAPDTSNALGGGGGSGGGGSGGSRGKGGGGRKAASAETSTYGAAETPSPAKTARQLALEKRKAQQLQRKALLEQRRKEAAEKRKALLEKRKALLEQRRKAAAERRNALLQKRKSLKTAPPPPTGPLTPAQQRAQKRAAKRTSP